MSLVPRSGRKLRLQPKEQYGYVKALVTIHPSKIYNKSLMLGLVRLNPMISS